jgi:8-oxo-dGTP pyrophosphatase MutT (NUDIX family)
MYDQWEDEHDNDTEFYGSKGAGAILLSKESGKFTLGFRSSEVRDPNCYGTFGGAVESYESPSEAVEREILEETGYPGLPTLVELHIFKDPNSDFEYHNYVAITSKSFDVTTNWENDHATEFTLDEIKALSKEDGKLHMGLKSILNDPAAVALLEKMENNFKPSLNNDSQSPTPKGMS